MSVFLTTITDIFFVARAYAPISRASSVTGVSAVRPPDADVMFPTPYVAGSVRFATFDKRI